MKTYFVSRHQGALEWFAKQNIHVDQIIEHLSFQMIQKGDCVIGILPIHLISKICAKGASYYHLSLNIPQEYRGKELTPELMDRFNAMLQRYHAIKLDEIQKPLSQLGQNNES